MSKRIALTFALAAVTGCGSNATPQNDMAAGGGNDMTMVVTTTIAASVMNKVTTPITVNAIVTGVVGDPAKATTWYVQDPAGGAYSGVAVFCDHGATKSPCAMSISAPALHDLIQVTGTLTQYHGKWELAPTAQKTTMANATPAAAAMISDADGAYNSTNAGLRGSPVKLMGSSFTVSDVTPSDLYDTNCAKADGGVLNGVTLCSGCMPPTYAGFAVTDAGNAKIYVEETFYSTNKLASSPECVNGASTADQVKVGRPFTALAGILDVDPYAPKGTTTVVLQPTSASDYQ